jgi:hypothetical protein
MIIIFLAQRETSISFIAVAAIFVSDLPRLFSSYFEMTWVS